MEHRTKNRKNQKQSAEQQNQNAFIGKETLDQSTSEDTQIAMRVSGISIAVNMILSLFKLLAGIFAHSGAMISDAVHSASDVFSTIVVIIGVHFSSKKADAHHQYGHERLECVSSILLAGVLFVTGVGIGISGMEKIIAGSAGESLSVPGTLALIAAVVSVLIKEWMYWFTRAAAKKINSGALMADAWHHRSDALSSVGSFAGILGAKMGYPILDPVASVIICLFIGKAAFDIFMDSINKMVDHSCDEETVQELQDIITSVGGVERIDLLQTRLFGSKMYVDIEIAADATISLAAAHAIAEQVHNRVETEFANVKHCMVHVNPI